MTERERVAADDLAGWRNWLQSHHRQQDSVWLVRWKKGKGPALSYADARDEALCWGWIDSLPRKLDDARSMLLMSPRRPGSGWSAINRARVAALETEGRMQPAGRAAIVRARADGSWDRLAVTDTLAIPPDLASALSEAGASASFDGFPPSSRRAILEWLAAARRPETRQRRTLEIAQKAARGQRALFREPAEDDRKDTG